MIYKIPNKALSKIPSFANMRSKKFLVEITNSYSPGDSPPTSEAWDESTEVTTLTALAGILVSVEGKTDDFFVATMTLLKERK